MYRLSDQTRNAKLVEKKKEEKIKEMGIDLNILEQKLKTLNVWVFNGWLNSFYT